jgi:hypothetical protein
MSVYECNWCKKNKILCNGFVKHKLIYCEICKCVTLFLPTKATLNKHFKQFK